MNLARTVAARRAAIARLAGATLVTAAALLAATGPAAAQAAAPGSAEADPKRPPAINYTSFSRFGRMHVSPANTHVAFTYLSEQGRRVLALVDLAKPEETKVLAGTATTDVTQLMWVNERRIAFHMERSSNAGERLTEGQAGTFAIDIDGGRIQTLIKSDLDRGQSGTRFRDQVLPYGWSLFRSLEGRGDEILVIERDVRVGNDNVMRIGRRVESIARLDTVTGRLTRVGGSLPDGSEVFMTGPDGEPQAVVARSGGRERLFQRRADGGWTLLEEHPLFHPDTLEPLFQEADGGWVVRSRRGRDTEALFLYDPRARKLDPEPLIAVEGFDVDDVPVFDARARTVIGASVTAARWQPVWFDERLATVQKELDTALPGRANGILCGNCLTAERFVVHSGDDRREGDYFLYDRPSKRLLQFASDRPWLGTASQGRRSFHRVPARDGLVLPLVVTHPPGAADDQPLPTVVLVHGGPWLRGATTLWSAEPQFLASRGYRVLEVEYRGSTGFGDRHFRAGWKQWGQAMQDDLVDALAWAEAQKLAEPGRACVVGGSYGGYAALMGPVTHPKAWRCAASINGVTDLTKMFSYAWTDISEQARRHDLRVLLGDPRADAAMLERHSPINRVAEIKVPLLVGQGDMDERVDPAHSQRFVNAARAAGVAVDHIRYTDEGHGFWSARNHADWLERLEAFLARHLGNAP